MARSGTKRTGPQIKIVIKELQPQQHKLAKQLEDLQVTCRASRTGGPPPHPTWDQLELLAKVDPRFNTRAGYVLVAFNKSNHNLSNPLGYYLADTIGADSVRTAYAAVHPDLRGLGIGTMLHDRMEEIALKKGIRFKESTISSHNLPSLVVNVNHQGFNIVDWVHDRYGPQEHRFYIKGKFGERKKPPEANFLAGLKRVSLNHGPLTAAIVKGEPFLLELVQEHGNEKEKLFKHIDWNVFHGTYIHQEGNRSYLLLEPKPTEKKSTKAPGWVPKV